jgi:hypothetical protein
LGRDPAVVRVAKWRGHERPDRLRGLGCRHDHRDSPGQLRSLAPGLDPRHQPDFDNTDASCNAILGPYYGHAEKMAYNGEIIAAL